MFSDNLELKFLDTARGRQFSVFRSLRAEVVQAAMRADFEALQPKEEYKPPPPMTMAPPPVKRLKTMGRQPEEPYRVDWVTRLNEYLVPKELKTLLSSHAPKGLIGAVKADFMPKGVKDVTWETFVQHWQTLLWVEEEQQRYVMRTKQFVKLTGRPMPRIDLLKYSLSEVNLTKEGNSEFY